MNNLDFFVVGWQNGKRTYHCGVDLSQGWRIEFDLCGRCKCFYSLNSLSLGMDLIFQFNQSWYILFVAFLSLWLVLIVSRKKFTCRREAQEQICLASAGLFTLLLMEVFATSTNLWQYIPGNWPIVLWPTYFVAILFGYQLLRFIEGLFP